MEDSINFYSDLKAIKEFNKLTEIKYFKRVPEDWYVIITDVRSSTKAIESGMYKTVNTVGALAIVSILNLTKGIKIPFIFGGDGATILIPPKFLEDAKSVLLDTAETAKDGFDLDLRIGIVPVKFIIEKGVDLLLSKYEVSKNYYQAIGTGGGLSFAEDLVKGGKFNIVKSLSGVRADFGGFECRWKDVPSPKEETISLIVAAIGDNPNKIYLNVLDKIDEIYGVDGRNPINSNLLSLSMGKELMAEGMVFSKSMMIVMFIYMKLFFSNIYQMLLAKASLLGFKAIIEKNVDYQKFDDTLKMVITGDKKHRKALELYLLELFKDEQIFYGIHQSEAAVMTCLVFQKNGEQVHFVDSANGGYALAAKKLKQQKKDRYSL